MIIGDRVAARVDFGLLDGNSEPIARGEIGRVVGRRGDDYVVRFGPGKYAVVTGELLAHTREAVHGPHQAR